MTKDQTRKLGIEFERRIQEIYPGFALDQKLDTDTIYSFLSEFAVQYVDNLILTITNSTENNGGVLKINDILKTLICHRVLEPIDIQLLDEYSAVENDRYKVFEKPIDYYRYIRTSSIVSIGDGQSLKLSKIPNKFVREQDVLNVMNSYINTGNIVRYPLVVWGNNSSEDKSPFIKVIHDQYTNITGLDILYYKYPYRFNILNYDDSDMNEGAVHSTCELPFSTFDDIVEGAVQMYISKYKFLLLGGNAKQQKSQPQQEQTQQAEA